MTSLIEPARRKTENGLKKSRWIASVAGAVLLLVLALWVRNHVHFEWSVFWNQIRHMEPGPIVAAIALIGAGYWLRALRWALLIRRQKRTSSFSLFGTQVMGFAAVALFGRLADLVRPYLVARRTSLTLSSQVAAYTLERTFDLAATAVLFAAALLLAPDRAALPHREAFERTALVAIAATAALTIFALIVRFLGEAMAPAVSRVAGKFSSSLGSTLEEKILAFREGLMAIASARDFLLIVLISLVMWAGISAAYLETAHAFVLSPELRTLTIASCLVLMAASMAGSIVQLPVIGWFTQIAVTTGVLESLFHVRFEPALGCSAMLLIIGFLVVLPLGMIWARLDHVSLKQISTESGQMTSHKPESAVKTAASTARLV